MATIKKIGLEYYPVETHISEDQKIEFLESEHGLIGYAVFHKILEKLYGTNGYYLNFDEREQKLFRKKRCPEITFEKFQEILTTCLEEKIFDQNIYDRYKVITSRGIQERFLYTAIKRDIIQIIPEYWVYKFPDLNNIRDKKIRQRYEAILEKLQYLPLNFVENDGEKVTDGKIPVTDETLPVTDAVFPHKKSTVKHSKEKHSKAQESEGNARAHEEENSFNFSNDFQKPFNEDFNPPELEDVIQFITDQSHVPRDSIEREAKNYTANRANNGLEHYGDKTKWCNVKGKRITDWQSDLTEWLSKPYSSNIYNNMGKKDEQQGLTGNGIEQYEDVSAKFNF